MSNLFISLRNVTIRYPDQTCFTNISFQIKEGEHWVFVGENEPLKNALIEALAGKAAIIKGRTEYHFFEKFKAAHNVNDPLLSATRLIAHVAPRHQFLNLSNTSQFYYQQRFNSSDSENALTVSEYLHRLKPALHTHGWTIDNTIAKLKLQPLLDEQLIKLSNGETRRLLIAAALLKSPVMLLLANPFNGLDVTSRDDLKMLINEVAASGITVVMSAAVNEIPDAITHVASFSNHNSISTQTKQRFRANVSTSLETESVDAAEVKSLMRLNGLPVFSNVVKMINVNIKYDDRLILNKINWTVRQGERWALSGHNGAGKSTLLSLISGDNPQAFATT